jgi:hypothetical protein
MLDMTPVPSLNKLDRTLDLAPEFCLRHCLVLLAVILSFGRRAVRDVAMNETGEVPDNRCLFVC